MERTNSAETRHQQGQQREDLGVELHNLMEQPFINMHNWSNFGDKTFLAGQLYRATFQLFKVSDLQILRFFNCQSFCGGHFFALMRLS